MYDAFVQPFIVEFLLQLISDTQYRTKHKATPTALLDIDRSLKCNLWIIHQRDMPLLICFFFHYARKRPTSMQYYVICTHSMIKLIFGVHIRDKMLGFLHFKPVFYK